MTTAAKASPTVAPDPFAELKANRAKHLELRNKAVVAASAAEEFQATIDALNSEIATLQQRRNKLMAERAPYGNGVASQVVYEQWLRQNQPPAVADALERLAAERRQLAERSGELEVHEEYLERHRDAPNRRSRLKELQAELKANGVRRQVIRQEEETLVSRLLTEAWPTVEDLD